MEFPENTITTTPARYIFKLISRNETILCNPEPIEWADGTFEMNRDLETGGVFKKFQLSTLTFVGNGADLLKRLFAEKEINAECTFMAYWFRNSDRVYVEFPSTFDINFNFYKIVKVGNFAFGVQVQAVNSSTQTKLDNRKDINIDVTKLVSIGDVEIEDYTLLKKNLIFAATNIHNYAELNTPYLNWPVTGILYAGHYFFPRVSGSVCYASLPFDIVTNDFPDEVINVAYLPSQVNIVNIPKVIDNAQFTRTLIINYFLRFDVLKKNSPSPPWEVLFIVSNSLETIFTEYSVGTFGQTLGQLEFNDSRTIVIEPGQNLRLVVKTRDINNISAYFFRGSGSILSFNQEIASSPEKTTEGFPIYEAIERTCQHILDVQYPIYSDFFGRTDVAYKSGTNYSTESQLRFAHIQSGLNQRGILLSDENNPLTLNFKNLILTAKCCWNTGYCLEVNEDLFGDTLERIRIENYAYFFQDVEIVLDPPLKDRIGKYDIVSEAMPELMPVNLKSGFNNFEYLEINGTAEPNTTNERTSIAKTDVKFENISPLRGDTKGILSNLSNPIDETGTEDTKGDNDIFIIKTQQPESVDYWIPEKETNIQIENNSSIFRENLLNRYFTPTRMLMRHANKFRAGFTKFDSLQVLRFQTSQKLQNLETTAGGVDHIKENDDILINTLDEPIYGIMKHTVECSFDFSDLELILATPYRYLRFSDTISGFLLNLKKKNTESKATITIIERIAP